MMYKKTTRIILATAAMAAMAAAGTASAQQVWRCGSTYQQQACPGGGPVAVDDARSPQQRAANLDAVDRASRMGEAMEQSRLKAEAQAPSVYVPKSQVDPVVDVPEDAPVITRPKKPAYFTARAPKKPKAAKAAKAARKSRH